MATVKCAHRKRGRPSHEWNDGEKDHIYCLGWIDAMTDELLPECQRCPDHVNRAQDDLNRWVVKDKIPHFVGVLILEGCGLSYKKKARRKDRTRPVSEMIMMMWRSSRRELVKARKEAPT